MTAQPLGRLIVGAIAGSVITLLLMTFTCALIRTTSPFDPRPVLAGQRVPGQSFRIDFDKRYDIYVERTGGATQIFKSVKILGFTNPEPEETPGSPPTRKSSYYDFFRQWLVLQQANNRLLYIPPQGVYAIEEAEPQ